jgi:Zn-dependent protease
VSSTVEGGRPLLRGRVLGFPVHVDASFLVIMALLGYRPGVDLEDIVLWLLITPFAVLVHELGHAVLARRAGAKPAIALAGFGGVTTFEPPHELSRGRSIGISLAGPGVGIVIGLLLVALGRAVELEPGSLADTALYLGQFTTLGWSLLNLLPVLPLDGGQALREVLPGDPEARGRRAAAVSVVVGVGVGFLALTAGYVFGAVFAAFLVVVNVLALRGPGRAGSATGGAGARPEEQVVALLWEGRREEAAAAAESFAAGGLDPAVRGAAMAVSGRRDEGLRMLLEAWNGRPHDADIAALFAVTHTLLGEWDNVVRLLDGPSGPLVPPTVVARARQAALDAGAPDAAERIAAAEGRAQARGTTA